MTCVRETKKTQGQIFHIYIQEKVVVLRIVSTLKGIRLYVCVRVYVCMYKYYAKKRSNNNDSDITKKKLIGEGRQPD